MKKKLFYFIAVSLFLAQMSPCVLAKSGALSTPVKIAIKKYKVGNYTGCLQDCLAISKKDPSNSIIYYYMAMSYVQAGKKDAAIRSYSRVLSLKPNPKLLEYATTGKRCLETPDKCQLETTTPGSSSDVDKFIARPYSDGLSDSVKADFEKKHLETVKQEINNNDDVDGYQLKQFKDYSKQHSQVEVNGEKIAQKKPSNDEIVAALKVLNDAGLSSYVQQSQAQAQQTQQQVQTTENVYPYNQANCQTPEQTQLNMLMGGNSQYSNNNAMMNMIPYMLAQSKDGKSNYSPQLMQSVIMNSMMTDFNFNLDTDKDKDK